MMKTFLGTMFFLSLLFVLDGIAQPADKCLISISLDSSIDRNKLENLRLPIYHRFENLLVVGLPEAKAGDLRAANIPYTVLDESPWAQKYYLVSRQKGNLPIPRSGIGNVLAADDHTALVKSLPWNDQGGGKGDLEVVEMKRTPYLFRNEKVLPALKPAGKLDSLITTVISEIRSDSTRRFIQGLQDFGTRYPLAPNHDSVAYWIQSQFQSMGYTDVAIDSFSYQGTWQKNVVATLPGITRPSQFIVVGGHHDSYSSPNPMITAPGADDNATGTVAALEMARAMKLKGFHPKSTIKFVTFAAEELGLWGSFAYAQKAKATGMNIALMVNHDMIGYTSRPFDKSGVLVNYYNNSESFRDDAMNLVSKFTLLEPLRGSTGGSGSDSYAFWQNGFPAIWFFEETFSPYYHSPRDILSNFNVDYCNEVIRASCATVISVSSLPSAVRDLAVLDAGNGTSLVVEWSRGNEPDVAGYHIYVGRASAHYDTVLSTPDSSFRLQGLTEGVQYYLGVSTVDADGYESHITEKTGTPYLKPSSPSTIAAEPQWHSIRLTWSHNRELDLLGYNIYRSSSPGDSPAKLNPAVIRDTVFTDATAQDGISYYYSVSATDSLFNESARGPVARSRSVSLNQGILIAGETLGGDGSPMNPTVAQVNEYYRSLLAGFSTNDFDVEAGGRASLADLGPFSTIVWHTDNPSLFAAAAKSSHELKKYLLFGGKILITSYRPAAQFSGIASYPRDFLPGDFVYDFLKIRHTEHRLLSRFVGAAPLASGYPPVYTDTMKTSASFNHHLNLIEGVMASPGATEIYRYDTFYDTSRVEGKMKGLPVGIESTGPAFSVVVVSFPLYYMNFEAAKSLVRHVLLDRFSEPTAVPASPTTAPTEFELSQNFPNPFNPATTVKFRIQSPEFVTLRVYDMLGREVVVLVNERREAGSYTVRFNANGLASGVYLYRLEAGTITRTKKLVVIK